MEARDILKRPVITEKSSEAMAEDKYTFDVDTRVNKTQVKMAVEGPLPRLYKQKKKSDCNS